MENGVLDYRTAVKYQLVVIEQYKDGPSSFLNYASYEIECTNYITFIKILIMLPVIAGTFIVYLILSGRIIMTCRKAAYAMIISVVFLITCVPLVGDNLIKGDDTVIHLIRLEGLKGRVPFGAAAGKGRAGYQWRIRICFFNVLWKPVL